MTRTNLHRAASRLLGIWIFAVVSTSSVHAQAPTAAFDLNRPHISAQGHAEVQTLADIAYLTISVTSEAHQESAAAQDNAARTAALIRAVRGLNIERRDIQTTDYTASRQFNSSSPVPALIGYKVTNTVRITLHNLSFVSRLIDLATQTGATSVTALTYDLTDRQAAGKRALTLAAQNARSRAEQIAAALNLTLGSLRSISDGGATFRDYSGSIIMNGNGFSNNMSGSPATPISPQEITVAADVSVDYNLVGVQ